MIVLEDKKYRTICSRCLQPDFSCYCAHIHKFDPKISFVILMHFIESRRRIATGRMSHLSLENSHLIVGQDYSKNKKILEIIADPLNHCMILYPGHGAQNLSEISREQRNLLIPPHKKMVIFVIDGTWSTAKKTLERSENLNSLPRICFQPVRASTFRVRRQPMTGFVSTIEAIHNTIELMGESVGFPVASREHDKLLNVFDAMVDKQLELTEIAKKKNGGKLSYRKVLLNK